VRTGSSPTALFVACTAIWGSTWLAITFQLGLVAPEASVAYRFALAALLLAAWCIATGRSLRFGLRTHGLLVAQGLLMFGLNYVAVYRAEQHVASGLVAVLFSTIVFLNPIGARLAFGTPLELRAIAGGLLGVTGVALLFLPELEATQASRGTLLGVAYALGATLLAVGGNLVSMRMQRAHLPIFATTAWGMGYGALIAAVVATLGGVAWAFDARLAYVASLAYLAVFGSVIAFGAYLTLLREVGPGPASFIGVATPVVAMLLSTLVEDYRWTRAGALGVALAVVGNVLALRAGPRRAAPDPPGP
jgi:drug/metabolite transporter (DMT)-like permease